MISRLLAQVTPEDIQKVGGQVQPLSSTSFSGNFPLVSLLWDIIASLFTIAVYGFLLAIIIGGFQYLISQGNDDAISKAKKTLTYSVIGLIIVFFGHLLIGFFVTQFGPSIVSGNVADIVANVYSVILALSGGLLLILLLVGGIRYMFALGDEGNAESAKKLITAAIIGIILVAAAFGIGRLILVLLQIPVTV